MDVIGKNIVLISIIIPVYNVENLIIRCVDSIFISKFQDFEIIIINDGSTDKTADVINELSLKYPKRIKIFHQENKGVSFTRNKGIELANGEYLHFIDGDDVLRKSFYDILVPILINKNPDILVFDHITTNEFVDDLSLYNSNQYIEVDSFHMIKSLYEGNYHGFVWDKLIKRDLIIQNNIRFNESIHFHEDNLFNFYLFDSSDNILYLRMLLYIHLRNNQSSMLRYYFSPTFDVRYIKTLDVFEEEKKIIILRYPLLYESFCNSYVNWCIRLYIDAKSKSYKSEDFYRLLIRIIFDHKNNISKNNKTKVYLFVNLRLIFNLYILLKIQIKKFFE